MVLPRIFTPTRISSFASVALPALIVACTSNRPEFGSAVAPNGVEDARAQDDSDKFQDSGGTAKPSARDSGARGEDKGMKDSGLSRRVDGGSTSTGPLVPDSSMGADPCSRNNGGCDALVTCREEGEDVTCGDCPSGYDDIRGDGTRCDPVDCGALAHPSHGSVATTNGTTYGEQATYSCDDGYVLSGATSRSCLSSGNWNSTAAACLDVDDCEGNPCDDEGDLGAECQENAPGAGYACECSPGFKSSGAAGLELCSPLEPFVVSKTAGCGLAGTAQQGAFSIVTSGTKGDDAADVNTGPWEYEREYHVQLPAGYDSAQAYPVVIQGPHCGGSPTTVYPLDEIANEVIKVGLKPPPNDIGHATNPGQGCFDDHEGDDSVDFPFYEAVMDWMKENYCYDQNRVFASGHSSGAFLANQLGCKYSGNVNGYRIRGIMPNTGGLPVDPMYRPTCSELQGEPLIDGGAMAGMWIHETDDVEQPFTGNIEAINRAMAVNGCTIGTTYQTATFVPYPIEGHASECKKMTGCPEAYPLVVCELLGSAHTSHDILANAGFSTFMREVIAYE